MSADNGEFRAGMALPSGFELPDNWSENLGPGYVGEGGFIWYEPYMGADFRQNEAWFPLAAGVDLRQPGVWQPPIVGAEFRENEAFNMLGWNGQSY